MVLRLKVPKSTSFDPKLWHTIQIYLKRPLSLTYSHRDQTLGYETFFMLNSTAHESIILEMLKHQQWSAF